VFNFSTKTPVEAPHRLIEFFTLELLLGGLVLLAFVLIARKRKTR
jgi:hypothetical protein